MPDGQNLVIGEVLRGYVERIERLRAEKKELGLAEKEVCAEAAAGGFDVPILKEVVKIRAMKPHDRQEAEAMLDMYLHALGMATEPPLFRFAGLAAIDTAAREQVIARMKEFVPSFGAGDIVVTMGGVKLRLSRNKEGDVRSEEIVERREDPSSPSDKWRPVTAKPPIPDTDLDGAFELGRQASRENKPVIENPFPYGDPRRAKFDEGWRSESGNDGFGPDRG